MSIPSEQLSERPVPRSGRTAQYRAEIVADSRDHLYRGVSSPLPLGVVIQVSSDVPIGAMTALEIKFPWGEVLTARASVHWSTQTANSTFRLGLRLVNPSLAVGLAIARAAAMFPTRLFDEHCIHTKPTADSTDCPATSRSPRTDSGTQRIGSSVEAPLDRAEIL
jgi:hypothetical protein